MKALFYTTQTSDCANHVRAWESAFGPTAQVTYDHRKPRHPRRLTWAINEHRPQVMFYIGAHDAPGNPEPQEFVEARKTAKLVNFCSDAGDKPWHPVLNNYRKWGCFDLQVGIDGAMAPVDLVTLTPVDTRPFAGPGPERDIRCGFSGTVGRWNSRSEIVLPLESFCGLTVRRRVAIDGYDDHASFLRRCRMVLNVSCTGTPGPARHIKGRVLEAGWAGSCLLESEDSPIGQWFPEDCYLIYGDPKDAARLIKHLDDATIDRTAARLAEEVRARFTPARIYGDILGRLGLVAPTEPIKAA